MSDQIHPRAVEAQARAEEDKAFLQSMKDEIRAAKEDGLRFVSIGDHSFCYEKKYDVLTFSTAVRNRRTDINNVYVGRTVALHRYLDGEVVQVRLRRRITARTFFQLTGMYCS